MCCPPFQSPTQGSCGQIQRTAPDIKAKKNKIIGPSFQGSLREIITSLVISNSDECNRGRIQGVSSTLSPKKMFSDMLSGHRGHGGLSPCTRLQICHEVPCEFDGAADQFEPEPLCPCRTVQVLEGCLWKMICPLLRPVQKSGTKAYGEHFFFFMERNPHENSQKLISTPFEQYDFTPILKQNSILSQSPKLWACSSQRSSWSCVPTKNGCLA